MPKAFYVLLAGEATSNLGDNLFDIAIMIYLYRLTSNSMIIGVISGIFNALVLLNILTGFIADKYVKTHVMQTVDLLEIVLLVIAAIAYAHNDITLVTIVGVAFISKFLGTFFSPAEDALIPQIIPTAYLNQANGLNQGLQMAVQIIGMLLGGALVATVSITYFVLINAATFLVSFICILIFSRLFDGEIVSETTRETQGNWYDGLRYIYQTPVLRNIVLLAMIVNFTLGPVLGLDVVWIKGTLHASSFMYSLAQVVFMVGVILGNVLVNLIHWQLKTKLLCSLSTIATAVVAMVSFRNLVVTLLSMTIIGAAGGFLNVSIFTLLQTRTPGHVLGRVNGAMLAGTNASLPLGMAIGGVISGATSVGTVFLIGAGVTLLSLLLIVRLDFAESEMPDKMV